MDTLGEMVKFSPPPPIHLTVTQEQADKIIEELRPQFRVGDRVRLKDSVTDEDLQDISITHGRRYVPNVMTVTERSPMHRIYTDSEFNFAPTMLEHVK
jgi:hypothetical protein